MQHTPVGRSPEYWHPLLTGLSSLTFAGDYTRTPHMHQVWWGYRLSHAADTRHMSCDPWSHYSHWHWALTCLTPVPSSSWFCEQTWFLPDGRRLKTPTCSSSSHWDTTTLSSIWHNRPGVSTPSIWLQWLAPNSTGAHTDPPQHLALSPCSTQIHGIESEFTQRGS